MRLSDLILRSARQAVLQQRPDGSMPPGHNGPYFDPETPVRNTAHWAILFTKAHTLSGDNVFKRSAEMAAGYLSSTDARPMGATFWCRKNPEKDFANGLVGQAWAIEALVYMDACLAREDLLRLAESVFILHPYDKKLGVWRRVNVDGSYNSFDGTFNHQLWFAAAGGLLDMALKRQNSRVSNVVLDFLSRIPSHIALYKSGLICHRGRMFFLADSLGRKAQRLLSLVSARKTADYLRMKSIGYHGFNLYGLALLKNAYPESQAWRSKKINAALRYTATNSFLSGLENNKYGYPYNPPGFEVAFALQTFDCGGDTVRRKWVCEQIRRHYDPKINMLRLNTQDEFTLAARLYEAVRLADCEL